jgi:prepilin-type N-terminal cleavage/methylation domain-containing protein
MLRVETRENRPGFSLLEIVVVVVILGILAAVVAPRLGSASDDRAAQVEALAAHVSERIALFQARTGALPTLAQLNGPSATVVDRFGYAYRGWGPLVDGGFLDHPPVNPLTGGFRVATDRSADWVYDPETGRLSPVVR